MAFYKTGYETTLGSAIQTKTLERSIKEALISDGIEFNTLDIITSEQLSPLFVMGFSPTESNIPLFAHPLIVQHDQKKYLCSDLRLFIRQERPVQPRNLTEFNFTKSRLILNLAWLNGSPSTLKNTLGYAATVFSAWLSEVIAKRFALDPRDQLTLAIISHFYFQSLHYPEDVFDEDSKQIFAVHTMKATKAGSATVFEVFDKLTKMANLEDFCSNVRTVLENVRLKDFNVGTLVTCVAMSWFGTNAKEIVAVALEHPPTWYAIVYSSLNERTFKNSLIAKVAERYGKGGQWDNYQKAYANLVHEYLKAQPDTRSDLEQFVIKDFKD